MTVPSEAYFGQLLWNNEATFNPGFSVEKNSDVVGMATSPSLVDVQLTQGLHYHVILGANGAVTINLDGNVLPPAPQLLTFWRDTLAVQGVDFQDLEDFSADDHELLHDRWARIDGELKGDQRRTAMVPLGDTLNTLPIFHTRKGSGQGTVFTFDGVNGQPKLELREDFIVPDGSITTIKLADGAVTTPKIADHAVTGDKIADAGPGTGIDLHLKAKWTTPFLALWGTNGGGQTDLFTVGAGLSIDFGLVLKVADLGISTGMLADLAVTNAKIADGAINNQKINTHGLDLPTIAAGATPDRLWGVDSSGLTVTYLAGPGLRIFHASPSTSQIEIGPSAITEDFIAAGAIITGHIAPAQIINTHIKDHTIDLALKAASSTANRLFGTLGTGLFSVISLGSGLTLNNGILTIAGAGTGSVNPVPPITTDYLASFADSTGNLIKATFVGVGLRHQAQILECNFNEVQQHSLELDALAALNQTNVIYYRVGAHLWNPVAIGANLTFSGGILSATAGGPIGAGNVNTQGSVTTSQITGYADSTGNLIKGVNVGAGLSYNGIALAVAFGAGGAQPYDPELAALASVVSSADMVPYFTGSQTANLTPLTPFARSLLDDADAATMRTTLGVDALQPLDDDLTAIAALTGTNTIYYRSGAGTWSPVVIGANLTFTGGTLSATGGGGGGGSVNTSGPVTASQLTAYADGSGNLIKGINVGAALTYDGTTLNAKLGAGGAQPYDAELAALAGVTSGANLVPIFTGVGAASQFTVTPFAQTLLDDPSDAAMRTTLGIDLSAFQPIDPDLTALAALTGTNNIYYRSAANTWSSVVIGANLTFTGGTLSATVPSGGGDVFLAANNAFTGSNSFPAGATSITFGNASTPAGPGSSWTVVNRTAAFGRWAADANACDLFFFKSRSGTIGTSVAPNLNDSIGRLVFRTPAPDASLGNYASIEAIVDAAPSGSSVPVGFAFNTNTATARRMTITSGGSVLIGSNTSVAGSNNLLQIDGTGSQTATVHIGRWANDATGSQIALRKSRGTTPGTHTAMQVNDVLGSVDFIGSDGSAFVTGAQVQATVFSVPSTGKMETGLKFWTRSNDGVLFERVRIWPSGCLQIGVASPLDIGPGSIVVNSASVKQAADVPSQGFLLQNAAATAQAYIFLGSAPAADFKFMSGPGPFNFYNTADQSNPIATIDASGCSFKGTNSNTSAAAGFIGEYPTSVTFSGAVAASATVTKATLTLTAGDWDVWVQGNVSGTGSNTTITIGLNTTTSLPANGIGLGQTFFVPAAQSVAVMLMSRFSLSGTTGINFIIDGGLNGLASCAGAVFARRRR